MKRIILKILIIVIIILSSSVAYLSIIGIETNKFNNQISILIQNINKDLEIELKKIKLVLDPLNFKINIKTIGPKIKIKKSKIDIQNINTNISIYAIFKKKFSLTNLEISTNSLEIKNLVSFLRNLENTPQLYLLEKIIKKGYIVSSINLEFNEQGKIKKNYKIKGFIRDGELSFLKTHNIKKIGLLFDIRNENYKLEDVNLLLNKIPLRSDEIRIKKRNNDFLVEGSFQNNDIIIKENVIDTFLNSFLKKYEIENFSLNLKNNFKFTLNKKLKISNLKFSSKIRLDNLGINNNLNLNKFFPNIKKTISFKDHLIDIDYKKNIFKITGSGNVLIQDEEDKINYSIIKKNSTYNFDTSLFIKKNFFQMDFLGYKKNKNLDAKINLKGKVNPDNSILIKSGSLEQDNNDFNFDKLNLNKDLKIIDLEKVSFDYTDKDLKRSKLNLVKKNNLYYLNGDEFNANYLLEDMLNSDNKNDLDFINKNFDLKIDIKKVHIDKENQLKDLLGNLSFKNNKILKVDINAFFSDQEKMKFTVNTKDNDKVTTLFLDRAEPLVKRYKFIKGFKNGSLDFYSVSRADKSNSTLKIYDFNLKELPILTKILTLASLQGIADILSGEGITFDEFEMNFRNEKKGITFDEIYAIGPAISILMDGYYIKNDLISLRGTLVPATTINKFVGSIPVLGKILVGKKTGEGVFGVSFKIKGLPKNPRTSVNPIKTLTPRFITRTLEKIKKN